MKITIITVTYNAGETLGQCLACLRDQSVTAEHIVVDGGSTDSTLAILEACRGQLGAVISEPDKGAYDAMNKGLRIASGDVVGILNADDYYPTGDILARVTEVFRRPEVDVCYGDLLYVDRKNPQQVVRTWRSGSFAPERFFWGWMPPHPTFFVRRAVYERHGLFNLELGSAADYEIMLRFLLRHRVQAAYLPEILVHMRTGGVSNATLANRLKANRMDRKAWAVNGLRPYPWTLLMKPLRKVTQWLVS